MNLVQTCQLESMQVYDFIKLQEHPLDEKVFYCPQCGHQVSTEDADQGYFAVCLDCDLDLQLCECEVK